jgi:4'-phosphopantetheinyl transferase EntD
VQSIDANPANLSATLSELFPPGTVAAELRGSADPATLSPEEALHVRQAVRKRAEEFAAGRLCARLLLGEFGIRGFSLAVGTDRQPLWPDTLVGSITHTAGFCAAVLAPKNLLRALGIDSEIAGSVKPELWRVICTPAETAWLSALPRSEQPAAATLIFSAKEAFYKCQFSATQERLGFHDASIEIAEWGLRCGVFQVHANRRIALEQHSALPLQGCYRFHEQFITAGLALPAVDSNRPAPLNRLSRRETP